MTGEPGADRDHAGVVVLPPVLYLCTLVAGLVLEWLVPLHWKAPFIVRIAGALVFVAAFAMARIARGQFTRAGTNVNPHQSATTIVSTGPFARTRNPMYVSITAAYLGLGLAASSLWVLLLVVPVLAIMHWGVVLREERYLEAKFGDVYRDYRRRVRRYF